MTLPLLFCVATKLVIALETAVDVVPELNINWLKLVLLPDVVAPVLVIDILAALIVAINWSIALS